MSMNCGAQEARLGSCSYARGSSGGAASWRVTRSGAAGLRQGYILFSNHECWIQIAGATDKDCKPGAAVAALTGSGAAGSLAETGQRLMLCA